MPGEELRARVDVQVRRRWALRLAGWIAGFVVVKVRVDGGAWQRRRPFVEVPIDPDGDV